MMKYVKSRMRDQRGVTFLEVMIAVVIMTVVSAAVLQLYITQHDHYLIQEDISNIQQNARASIDELSRHIRMAGHDLPLGLPAIVASNTNPDTIMITYQSRDCETFLSAAMPLPSAELKCGSDISCFYDGQWVYIYDPDAGSGEWFEITQVQVAALHLQHNTMVLSKAYDEGAIVLSLEQIKFFVDNTTDPNHPNLMVQLMGQAPQVYAEDIQDLQFQYGMKNGIVVDEPLIPADVREVMITVEGRSRQPSAELADRTGEEFRHRTYATSVHLRNVGL
ncbi:MAG: prepilin-type N-terminal cleavage/methylation domain-containing protein [Candidatus Zixiibacteriota bacterium]